MWIFETISLILNLLWSSLLLWLIPLFFFIITGWGLYNINKKIWEKYAWLSWIPLVQIYMIYKAGWKSFFMYFIMPVLIMVLANWWMDWMSSNSKWLGIFVLFLIPQLLFIIFYIITVHWISKRTGHWFLTTIWFIVLPFIFFPLVWYKSDSIKLKDINDKINFKRAKDDAEERKKDLNIQDADLDAFN